MDFANAFKRPFSDIKKLVIGVLLNILPIVNFLAMGYVLKSAERTLKKTKDFSLPEWNDWGDLFIKGLMSVLIALVYAVPLLILGLILFPSLGLSFLSGFVSTSGFDVGNMLTGLATIAPLLIIFMLLAILTSYIVPSALISYIKGNYKFGEAFKFGTVFKNAFKGQYFLAWIVYILVSWILALLLNWVWVLGSAFAGFVSMMIGITLLAQVWGK